MPNANYKVECFTSTAAGIPELSIEDMQANSVTVKTKALTSAPAQFRVILCRMYVWTEK